MLLIYRHFMKSVNGPNFPVKRCELAFKRINGSQLPDYLSASLRKNSDVHSRNTRNCDVNLLCPLHRNISEGGRTFAVRTVKDWNNLPRSLKTRRSLKSFKAELWKIVVNSHWMLFVFNSFLCLFLPNSRNFLS